MGADIHAATERRVGDKWVMVTRLHWSFHATNRNYERFAALAGVRGEGPEPRGLPDDVSDSVRLFRDEWGIDGHSDSWLPLDEAAQIWLETEWAEVSDFVREYPASHYFDIETADRPGMYRIVFWFDN